MSTEIPGSVIYYRTSGQNIDLGKYNKTPVARANMPMSDIEKIADGQKTENTEKSFSSHLYDMFKRGEIGLA